jgi:glucokinase
VDDFTAGEFAVAVMMNAGVGLVGDIGATNARFALVQPDGKVTGRRVYALSEHASLADAIDAYLADESPAAKPMRAALAVAAPVTGHEITMTNHPWAFTIEALQERFGLQQLHVANAAAVPHLAQTDRIQIGGGQPVDQAPVGIIGPGTGLGVSAMVPTAKGPVTIAGEGGHITMTPATAQESAILDIMRRRYDHVSAERLLSGAGLVNLYSTWCEVAGWPAASYTAEQITNPVIWDQDPRTRETTSIFCAMLGTVAGNLALTLGARGGIYIAGGIVPRMATSFAQSEFRSRFEAKGRLKPYLAAIPTYLIIEPMLGLLGAATLLGSN